MQHPESGDDAQNPNPVCLFCSPTLLSLVQSSLELLIIYIPHSTSTDKTRHIKIAELLHIKTS
jgi:hypothetical protein